MKDNIHTLFHPNSIAVIGASRQEDGIGRVIMNNLLTNNYQGLIFPVNPKAHSIMSFKAFSRVTDIPDPVDLAIIAIPRSAVVEVMKECAEKDIGSVIIISAGFGETDEKGKELEDQIIKIAGENNMAVVGPNCLGIICTDPEVRMNATFAEHKPEEGNISFISQSGAVGIYALEYARQHNIHFSKFVSLGNKAVSNENDMLHAFLEDKQTEVILAYLEDFEDPEQFFDLAQKNATKDSRKAIIAIKSGKSSSGQRAAASHTGALTKNEAFLDDLFHQYGIIRVNDLETMFQSSLAFDDQPQPSGKKLCILTNAGGPGIISADAAENAGLEVPEFSDELQEQLSTGLPATASLNNPVDLVGDADANRYRKAMDVLIESDEVDIFLILCAPPRQTNMREIAETIGGYVEQAKKRNKLIVAAFADFTPDSEIFSIFSEHQIPTYKFGINAITACESVARFHDIRSRPDEEYKKFDVDKEKVRNVIEIAEGRDDHFLTEAESYQIFEAYGFQIASHLMVREGEDISEKAASLSFPLAAKVMSPQIVHKSDVGAVITGISNKTQLEESIKKMKQEINDNKPDADIQGILLQEMVDDGTELIMGVKYEEGYGHLLMFGVGGIFVEVIKDVTYRRTPVKPFDARSMIRGIKYGQMLEGIRNKPKVNKEILEEYLLRLSQLVTDFPEIREIDLNPVFGMGDNAVLADARVFVS